MGAAVVMTLASMIDYFINARDVLVGPWSGSASLVRDAELQGDRGEDEGDDTTA